MPTPMAKSTVTEVRPGVLVEAPGLHYFSAAALFRAGYAIAHEPGPAPDDPCDFLAAVIGHLRGPVAERIER